MSKLGYADGATVPTSWMTDHGIEVRQESDIPAVKEG